MLCKLSQRKPNAVWFHSYVEDKTTATKQTLDTENTLVVPRGKGERRGAKRVKEHICTVMDDN